MDHKTYPEFKSCSLCPRKCCINRHISPGACGEGDILRVARAGLHMWEEPCISGSTGSGAVFFTGCSMKCVFCQNREISRGSTGMQISEDRLIEIFHELKKQGANNINLVSGDIFIPAIRSAILKARDMGFDLPFVLNTSSYVNVETLRSLEDLIDIYLPDMKYIRNKDAACYSRSEGYVEAAKAAIDEMVKQQPKCEFIDAADGNRIMKKGVLVRHLLMPGMLIQAKLIVKYLYDRYGDNIYISLMSQYTPGDDLDAYPKINRRITESEYHSLVKYARELGITNAYVQELDAADSCFIPSFDLTGV